ncbi:MAG TPA: LptE family protein [Candidatus Hydrogenedentes bacterium]|nr:LptE family protein [Candidatus Hydrogenedentota bacterium]
MKHWLIFTLSAVLVATLFTGCGYRMKSELDPKYQTIAISAFYDETREYDLQAPLTNALVRKFINDGRLRVVPPDDADLLLEGKITKYQLRGMTYDAHDETTQFGLVICAAVRLRDQQTGETLWEEPLFAGETTFYTRAFGQSSDRLRGNAEAFIPSVRSFSTEEENRAASEALEQLASDIFYRTVELW